MRTFIIALLAVLILVKCTSPVDRVEALEREYDSTKVEMDSTYGAYLDSVANYENAIYPDTLK